MTRREAVLAAMAPAEGDPHTPTQLEELLFLVDREIPGAIGGPVFDFQPLAYGPADKQVSAEAEALAADGLVVIVPVGWRRTFALTPRGQKEADRIFGALPDRARDYLPRASEFVLKHRFTEIVAAINRAYPEMRANSVFRDFGG